MTIMTIQKNLSKEQALTLGVDTTREGITFIHGGHLVKSFWHYDESVGAGEYHFYVVAKKDNIYHLMDNVALSPYVKLKDILLFTQKHSKVLTPIINNWCEEFCEAGLKDIKPYDATPNDKNIEYLELYRLISIDEDGANEITGLNRVHFHGIGFPLKEASDGFSVGERITWGISLSKINELSDMPLKLKNEVNLYEKSNDYKKNKKNKTYQNTEYTLLEIIYAIFYEISFHGNPNAQEKMADDLKQSVEEIKNNVFGEDEDSGWLKEFLQDGKK